MEYFQKFNHLPTKTAIEIALQKKTNLNEEDFKAAVDTLTTLDTSTKDDLDWLMVETEAWCKEQALHNAIKDSIEILGDEKHPKGRGAIPQIVQDALAVSFNTSVGHDYIEDADERHAFYHRTEYKIPFNLKDLDRVTKGGVAKKTLTLFTAGTNVGKSLIMCHLAANALLLGKNALYITLEMAREKIAQRIDANLLDVSVNDLESIPKDKYDDKIAKLKSRINTGKLIVEEYPPTCAGVTHFKNLLNELKIKRKFIPDIIFIDYINLAISSRLKLSNQNVSTYTYVKAISEEFRSLAVSEQVAVVTATQLNRKGYASNDPGMEDTSESFGLPMTTDENFIVISNDELRRQTPPKLLFKHDKSRDNEAKQVFLMAVDYPKMRIYDIPDDQQPKTDPTSPSALYQTVGNSKPVLQAMVPGAPDGTFVDKTTGEIHDIPVADRFREWTLDDSVQP